VLIFGAVLWTAFDVREWGERGHPQRSPTKVPWTLGNIGAYVLAAAVFVQIMLGGLVAGTDAGLSHTTWPLMDGAFIPDGLGAMQPWWHNLFENVLTVQFNHRMMGYCVALLAAVQALLVWRTPDAGIRASAALLLAAVLAQIGLGVATLLSQVQIGVALAHQAGAIAVFALALHHLFLVRRQPYQLA
jgi:cytochrome c oxidase assembly protein subunit 15